MSKAPEISKDATEENDRSHTSIITTMTLIQQEQNTVFKKSIMVINPTGTGKRSYICSINCLHDFSKQQLKESSQKEEKRRISRESREIFIHYKF